MKKILAIFLALFAILSLTGLATSWAAAEIKISILQGRADSPIIEALVQEMGRRAGVAVKIERMPSARALILTDQGTFDGFAPRELSEAEQFTNLIRVVEPLRNAEIVAFSKGKGPELEGWESLASYRIAYLSGNEILKTTPLEAKAVMPIESPSHLFKMLYNDEADLALAEKLKGQAAVKELGIKGIEALKPPLAIIPLYLFLHQKHQILAEEMAQALRNMKGDGTHQKIIDSALLP